MIQRASRRQCPGGRGEERAEPILCSAFRLSGLLDETQATLGKAVENIHALGVELGVLLDSTQSCSVAAREGWALAEPIERMVGLQGEQLRSTFKSAQVLDAAVAETTGLAHRAIESLRVVLDHKIPKNYDSLWRSYQGASEIITERCALVFRFCTQSAHSNQNLMDAFGLLRSTVESGHSERLIEVMERAVSAMQSVNREHLIGLGHLSEDCSCLQKFLRAQSEVLRCVAEYGV